MNAPLSKIAVLRHALAGPLNVLTRHKQFILYQLVPTANGRLDKVPVSPRTLQPASAHDPANWHDVETACALAENMGSGWGVGFVLTADDDLWCHDIDGALQDDDRTWSPLALNLCGRFAGAAIEVSVSGRGLHIWGSGTVPAHSKKNTEHHIELYTEGHFIALSGTNAIGDAGTRHDAAIAALVAQYFMPKENDAVPFEWASCPCAGWAGATDDDELVEQALAHVKPKSAAEAFGGAVHASFRDLWKGNEAALSQVWPGGEGKPFDASSADHALAKELAYWTGKDCERIERLMRKSALVREKWDEHQTYLRRTITDACAKQMRFVGDRAASTVLADYSAPHGFIVTDGGVLYNGDDGDPAWICSALFVTALARDKASDNWGRVLEWRDADGLPHQWVMPMEMLKGDGADMRGELARLGLRIAPGNKARNKLTEYITVAQPDTRARCVTRTGWHDSVFVMPDRTIGNSAERVLFQTEIANRTYAQAGTLADWKDTVARFCVGNNRLLLAVSSAFAGMLLHLSGQESGGVHFVGDSSTGKTTALRAACSVFGGPDYLQRWRATSNGLEGLAAVHNDSLLVLDEMAQVDPREAGEIAYMLANGSGKQRAARTGAARNRQSWRLLFLSSGEIGLSQHMHEGGKRVRAGQEVRLVDIPADAGAGHGLFETLHGMAGGAQLSQCIVAGTEAAYGAAAIAFLEHASTNLPSLSGWLKNETAVFMRNHLPNDASGQATRVCQRFALIGLAGECATAYGVTGWPQGAALNAAAHCFKTWLDNRGGAGNQEQGAILAHVKAFFESHEESRFTPLSPIEPPEGTPVVPVSHGRSTINRAGFKRASAGGGFEYLVLPEVFKREICNGYEPGTVTKVLIAAGWIKPDGGGRASRSERIPGGKSRVYVFTSKLWEG